IFDVLQFHPKIVKPLSPLKCWDYYTKEDETPLTNTTRPSDSKVRKHFVHHYVLSYEKLEYFAKRHFQVPEKPYVAPPDEQPFINITPEMQNWVNRYIHNTVQRPKSLVLIGPTRLGKTQWARSLGKHTYYSGHLNTNSNFEYPDYAVFDNFSLDHFPH
ncbi:hypothetical protein DFQ28_011515, partial [Apophysomyces sp. BC1034]